MVQLKSRFSVNFFATLVGVGASLTAGLSTAQAYRDPAPLTVGKVGELAAILDPDSGRTWVLASDSEVASQEKAIEVCRDLAPKGNWALPKVREMQDATERGLMGLLPQISAKDKTPDGARRYWMDGQGGGTFRSLTSSDTTDLSLIITNGPAQMYYFYPYKADRIISHPHRASEYKFPVKPEYRVLGGNIASHPVTYNVGQTYPARTVCVSAR